MADRIEKIERRNQDEMAPRKATEIGRGPFVD